MGPFYNKTWVNIISWTLIIILSILNIYLIVQTFQELQVKNKTIKMLVVSNN